jgi:hypothetical protein
VKEVDDTPLTESKTEDDLWNWVAKLEARVLELEKELALALEQRVSVRDPADVDEDPEWY